MDSDDDPYHEFDAGNLDPNDIFRHKFKQRGMPYEGTFDDGEVLKNCHKHLSTNAYTGLSHTRRFKGYGSVSIALDWYENLPRPNKAKVKAASFHRFMKTLPPFQSSLFTITALAERWWDTTNTFHFPFGEMTMTPKDFSMLTGLRIGGWPLLFCPKMVNYPARIEELLGSKFMARYEYKSVIHYSCLFEARFSNRDTYRVSVL